MPRQPDRDGGNTVVASCALLLVPVVCCGLPLLVASGTLAGVGSWLHSIWLAAIAIALLAIAGLIAWRTHSSGYSVLLAEENPRRRIDGSRDDRTTTRFVDPG
ncbi:MAG TPA: hypothetical protein VFX16_10355 [Pseudonocardiaceae bacterium]|nr:hypothetical protein [Pseudonocardiaceae bacterium]